MAKNSLDQNPIIAALQSVYLPLIKFTSKLPAPLAYGSAVLIAFLVTTALGVVIPDNLILLLGAIVFACLAAFVFLDWNARHPLPAHSEPLKSDIHSDAPVSSPMTAEEVMRRYENRTAVEYAVRLIPKSDFYKSEFLGRPESKYVFIGDYAEQRNRRLQEVMSNLW